MRRSIFVFAVLGGFILVPFYFFGERLDGWPGALAGVPRPYLISAVVGMLAADVVLPIPSSAVSVLAGASAGFGWGFVAIWLGATAACVIGYVFGRWASSAAVRFVGPEEVTRLEGLAAAYGDMALVMCRGVPVLAEASAIVSGLLRRPLGRFLLVTSLANAGMAAAYAGVGAYAMRTDAWLAAFFGAIVVPGVLLLLARWRRLV